MTWWKTRTCVSQWYRLVSPTVCRKYFSVEAASQNPPSGKSGRISLVVRVPNTPGSLTQPLAVLGKHQVNLSRIESRPVTELTQADAAYNIFVNVSSEHSSTHSHLMDSIKRAVDELSSQGIKVTVLGDGFERTAKVGGGESLSTLSGIPWFPRKMRDLDSFASRTLEVSNSYFMVDGWMLIVNEMGLVWSGVGCRSSWLS